MPFVDKEEDLRLLSVLDFEAMTDEDREEAVSAAGYWGSVIVEIRSTKNPGAGLSRKLDRPLPEPWLTHPTARDYLATVIDDAQAVGLLDGAGVEAWRQRVYVPEDRLDPRVRAFLREWKVRGSEIVDIQRGNGLR